MNSDAQLPLSSRVYVFLRSNVVGFLALFVALNGTAMALQAAEKEKGPRAGKSAKKKRGPRGPRGFPGPQGPAGPQGTSGGGGLPSGAVPQGGDLAGSYPSPVIAANAVGDAELQDILRLGTLRIGATSATGEWNQVELSGSALRLQHCFPPSSPQPGCFDRSEITLTNEQNFLQGDLRVGDDVFVGNQLNAGLYEAFERTSPGDPPANRVFIYARDTADGDTQLVARFDDGDVDQLAIEGD